MTVYNVNLGIGWASSGVEYAQAYRARALRQKQIPAKFIFSDLILANNIEDLTANLGFTDDQIIWFYNFFTDAKIAPSDYPLTQWEQDVHLEERGKYEKKVTEKEAQYTLPDEDLWIGVRFHDAQKQTIDQVSYVTTDGLMVKRDFYSYTKYACEYYSGEQQNNHVTFREFYNEDGSVAYTEYLTPNKGEVFEFPHQQIYYSKNDLYREMIRQLNWTANDVVILDRTGEGTNLSNGQIIFEEHQPAKMVVVVHADHYDQHYTDNHRVLWNNYYEYSFTHPDDVASFVVATDKQKDLLLKQEEKYYGHKLRVDTIPVGSLDQLRHPEKPRKRHSLITASRLATEKHLDWLVKAVAIAREQVSDVTLDIYGQGVEHDRLKKLIDSRNAGEYIRLMGQHDLTNTYTRYDGYVAASTSEGFGLSLLEAVGSGLPMIGFDVPYGNQTFIDNGQNGYLLEYNEEWSDEQKVASLAKAIVRLFTEADLAAFSKHSYQLAVPYLQDNIAAKWQSLLEELVND